MATDVSDITRRRQIAHTALKGGNSYRNIAACNRYKAITIFRRHLPQNQTKHIVHPLCNNPFSFRSSSLLLQSQGWMQLHVQVNLRRAILIRVSWSTSLGNHGSTAVAGYTNERSGANSREPLAQGIIPTYWRRPPTHTLFTIKYICTSGCSPNGAVHHIVPLRQWDRKLGSYLPEERVAICLC